jgi:phosphatidylglycerophosphate synthase
VPDFCNCGAELPADARFCHKCGKPQREEDIPRPEIAETPIILTPPAPPPPVAVNFRNLVALRVGFLSAFLAFVLSSLLPLLMVIWSTIGGFFSVYLYRRRTGERMTIGRGARIGWITGIMMFLIMAGVFGLFMVLLSNVPGGVNGMAEQLRGLGMQKEKVDQFVQGIQYLQNPLDALKALFTMFVMVSVATTIGGALGARLGERR